MAGPIPPFGEEHEAFRRECRDYVAAELAPHADAWEEARWFDDAVFPRLAADGFLGLKFPAALGGSGRGWLHDAVWTEELARCGSGGTAAGIGAHTGIATPPVWRFGTPAQHERWLAPALRGERIAALGITEPGAGSDVAAIRTRAERVDGGWVVNGEKTYITNGVRADFVVTAVVTNERGGHDGISFLVVDRGAGVTSAPLAKLGWHASDTATIALQDVAVDDDALLGREHEGFKLIMANFQWERLLMSLGAVGAMAHAFERAAAAAPAGQAARHALADVETSVHACRCVTYDALRRFAAGEDATRPVTMAKLLTQRAAVDAIDTCLRLTGDPLLERALRDARLGPIGGGTDEVMREILARSR
jgi:acyl-CoA dehydrogenase